MASLRVTFNFLLLLSGIGLIVGGAVVKRNLDEFSFVDVHGGYGIAATNVTLGVVVILASCCFFFTDLIEGNSEKKHFMGFLLCNLFTSFIILSILLITSITGFTKMTVWQHNIDTFTENLMVRYDTDVRMNLQVDYIHHRLKCCGYKSYTDWFAAYKCSRVPLEMNCVPKSCCKTKFASCAYTNVSSVETDAMKTINTKGCAKMLTNEIISSIRSTTVSGVMAAVVCLIDMLITTFSMISNM